MVSSEAQFDEMILLKRSTTSMDTSTVSMKEAICGRKYWRAALICFILNFFNQYTGVTPVLMYAGSLLEKFAEVAKEASEDGASEFPISPTEGSMIIGLVSLIATIIAYFLIKHFGRKSLFLIG